jgi:hypothetical protein
MDNKDRWCFAWFAHRKSQVGKDRAALLRGARWRRGSVISISFLDGDPVVQRRVKRAALKWTALGLANLTFEFREAPPTWIRISFQFEGSWSSIGTTCLQITDQTQPTMNLGWLTRESTKADVEQVVLHEFGHAIGLIHEHQSPGGEIHWNRIQVAQDLSGPPNHWSAETIKQNMFEPYSKLETNYTELDPLSIMMYPLPGKWTIDGFSVGLNNKISRTDKTFIHSQYP